MATTDKKPERTTPDRSPEAKLQRAIDALNGAASAYFDAGKTDTAVHLRTVAHGLKGKLDGTVAS